MKKSILVFIVCLLGSLLIPCAVFAQDVCDCADLLQRIEALEQWAYQNDGTKNALPVASDGNAVSEASERTQSADGHVVTLLDYELKGDKIIGTFRIENAQTTDDITLSTLLDWSAKDNSGQKLKLEWLDSNLEGTLVPGDFIKGQVVFSGVTEMPVRFQYSTALWGGTTLMFITD